MMILLVGLFALSIVFIFKLFKPKNQRNAEPAELPGPIALPVIGKFKIVLFYLSVPFLGSWIGK